MYLHFSQASTSRLASSARRSFALQCNPAACHSNKSADGFLCMACAAMGLLARRLLNLAWASPGVGNLGNWYRDSFRIDLMTLCTSKSG